MPDRVAQDVASAGSPRRLLSAFASGRPAQHPVLRRRQFLVLIGAGLVVAPISRVTAQSGPPRIGYLMDRPGPGEFDQAFREGLRELGYVIGRSITIEERWTNGQSERLPALAADLVAAKVDVIVVAGAASVKAAKAATASIPIVMASSQDAVGDGLVANLAHPGANVTGRSVYAPELTPKRVELLKELLPGLPRIGVMWNTLSPGGLAQWREAEAAAKTLGVAVEPLHAQIPEDLESAMDRAVQAGAGAILILSDSATISHRFEIGDAARRHRLPTLFANKAYLEGGGLMSYGPDIGESFRLSAAYIDKILKGAKPEDLPVELPTRFELAINAKAAKALGLEIPPSLLARADEVIE